MCHFVTDICQFLHRINDSSMFFYVDAVYLWLSNDDSTISYLIWKYFGQWQVVASPSNPPNGTQYPYRLSLINRVPLL